MAAAWAPLVAFGALLVVLLCVASSHRQAAAPRASLWATDCEMRVEVVHHDPLIRVVHGFTTLDEAQAIIDKYAGLLKPSTVVDNKDHAVNIRHVSRTSYSAFLPAGSGADPAIAKLEQRAVLLTGKRLQDMETLQLVRYQGQGQFYNSHYDYFHDDPPSQRTITIFVYLSDTRGEGPTQFNRLGLNIAPAIGKACIWENCAASGKGLKCDDRLEHAGMPLKSPDIVKYGVNIWFRSLPFR
jgi:prolyl 4-hydroxylase